MLTTYQVVGPTVTNALL